MMTIGSPLVSGLSKAIHDALLESGLVTNAALQSFATNLATAIITEIQTNAVVTPTLLVAPPGGGPVTGTGVVT